MSLKILILEHDYNFALKLQKQFHDWGYEVLDIINHTNTALSLLSTLKPDIVILNTQLPGKLTVMDLSKTLNDLALNVICIANNSNRETYEKVTHSNTIGYLVKPFGVLTLKGILDFSFPLINTKIANCLYLSKGKERVKVGIYDIVWIKSDGNYCELHTSEKTYIIKKSLSSLVDLLPVNDFLKIHKSYAVQLQKIEALSWHQHILKVGGAVLPIGRKFKKNLRSRIVSI